MMRLVLVCALVALATAGKMKMFELNENHKYEQVLVAVSSTVIPIDDLPTYQVGVGVGVKVNGAKPKGPKPKGDIKLITIHSKKNGLKNKNGAKVEEVTPEEYKKITKKHYK